MQKDSTYGRNRTSELYLALFQKLQIFIQIFFSMTHFFYSSLLSFFALRNFCDKKTADTPFDQRSMLLKEYLCNMTR